MLKRKPRGRPRKGSAGGKTAAFSSRITPELRKRLEQAADAGHDTLTDEIEQRLWQSFEFEEERARVKAEFEEERARLRAKFEKEYARFAGPFGGNQNYAVARTFAELMKNLSTKTGKQWADDPWTYEQFRLGVLRLLNEWRPAGTAEKPAPVGQRELQDDLGDWLVSHQLAILDFTDEYDPAAEPSDSRVMIKLDLGDLATRRQTLLHED